MPESLKKFSAAVLADFKKALNSQPTEDLIEKTKAATDGATFKVIISTSDEDRQGDAIDQSKWKLGFDFGGQTFSQVFSSSLAAMKSDFPSKPLWILSTGSVDSPTAFIQSAYSSGVSGIVWFSYQQFSLTSTSISTIQTF
jgi:hypothetical protein